MYKFVKISLILSLIIISAVSLSAADKLTCYTMWDDLYLYAAFQVQDPDIISTNTSHMSKTWNDDSVEVYIETDAARANNRSDKTFVMTASAGGGTNFNIGENGLPKEKKIFTFKFAKSITGSLNRPNDKDTGYVVELAIPWRELGITPKTGQFLGFNLVCRLKGENVGFASLSPDVVAEDDLNVPAKWSKIVLTDAPSIVSIQDGAYVCRKVRIKAPLIDGIISANEWVRNLAMQIDKPEPPAQLPREMYVIENPVLTHYFYWYQGDKRKEAPYTHMINADGSDALTTHPLDGNGFWMSNNSVEWHKEQLSAISNSGVDIIIPIYWGSASDKKSFASKGLNCMVGALKELKSEKREFPLVGMFFDTTAMMSQYGSKPDLRNDEVKQTFYGMIKDFYLQIPDEFLASIQLPADKGGVGANIIVLYTSNFFSGFDSSFIEYCNRQFEKDFGKKLIWTGSSDFRTNDVQLDGYCNYGAGLGLQYDDNGLFSMAGVGVGFDNAAVPGGTMYRPRYNGETYKKDWDSLIAVNPAWVIVDGWNELHEGSDFAPSREYGERYTGLTKINILRFNGMRSYDAKYLKHDIPSFMNPGASSIINLVVKNSGSKPWYAGQGIYIAARWYKDGILVSDTGARLPMQEKVLAGQSFVKSVGVKAVDQEGKPLPEGDYELRIDMMHGNDEWFSSGGDIPLCVPVKITSQPTAGFTLVSSSLSPVLKSGAVYNVDLQIRNDSSATWKTGSKIAYKWYKVSVHLSNTSTDNAELIGVNESAASIASDVEPGRTISVSVPVSVSVPNGGPLPVWTSDDMWTYILKWDVFDNGSWLASDKIGVSSEAIKVSADDFGVKFVSADMPKIVAGGKKYPIVVSLKNIGTDIWKRNDFKLGYHIHSIDGREIKWDNQLFQLPNDVKQGENVDIKANFISPEFDGQYYIVWDAKIGEKWTSSSSNTKGDHIAKYPVNVIDGKLMAIGLSALYDEDIISTDTNPTDGALDSTGNSIPSQFIPPFASPISNPALWACGSCNMDSNSQISFAFPSKMNGIKNAIACKGQNIAIKSGKYTAMHIIALATQETIGEFTISYKDKKVASSVKVAGWDSIPADGTHAAVKSLYRYSANGPVRQPAYICHYAIPLDADSNCTGIVLPDVPSIKIIAATLVRK